jgi:hypothetical protein
MLTLLIFKLICSLLSLIISGWIFYNVISLYRSNKKIQKDHEALMKSNREKWEQCNKNFVDAQKHLLEYSEKLNGDK